MTTITHPELVAALAKSGQAIMDEMTPQAMHCLHMAVGVSGEVGELCQAFEQAGASGNLDMDNLIEELGDLEFYLEGLRQGLRLTRADVDAVYVPKVSGAIPLEGLVIHAANLLDLVKKYSIYVKPVDMPNIMNELRALDLCMSGIYSDGGLDSAMVLQRNIDKLTVRYSSGSYSNQQAQTRADKPAGE